MLQNIKSLHMIFKKCKETLIGLSCIIEMYDILFQNNTIHFYELYIHIH